MDAEVKRRWVEALRSGEYKQTQKVLRDSTGFCCLGVLADVEKACEWEEDWNEFIAHFPGGRSVCDMLPENYQAAVGLRGADAGQLAEMNDDGHTFADIANHIEENL